MSAMLSGVTHIAYGWTLTCGELCARYRICVDIPAVVPPIPSSSAQADAISRGALPPAEEIRDGIWTFPIAFSGGIPTYTLCYLIEGTDGRVTVIDPGWGVDGALAALEQRIADTGHQFDDIAAVVVTHAHVDHAGAVPELRRRGVPVIAHAAEQTAVQGAAEDRERAVADVATWGVPDALRPGVEEAARDSSHLVRSDDGKLADVVVEDGEALPIVGRRIVALWTPGHTSGHLGLVDEPDGLLFTGDHVLPRINPGIGLGGRTASNPLDDSLASLDKVRAFANLEVCPGHEYRFSDVTGRAVALAAHREQRTDHVRRVVDGFVAAGHRPTLYEVACEVPFRGGVRSMSGFLLASALAQTGFHARAAGNAEAIRLAG